VALGLRSSLIGLRGSLVCALCDLGDHLLGVGRPGSATHNLHESGSHSTSG